MAHESKETMNPAKLIEQWRTEALDASRPDAARAARRRCARELKAAYRPHPMTDEPEGGEGVEVCIWPEDEDRAFADWDMDCDAWACDMIVRDCLSWGEIRDRYPNATWCYLPPRGDHG